MTPAERELYEYIVLFNEQNGISPTTYDLADGLHKSRSSIRHLLIRLVEKGFIEYYPTKRRSIHIVAEDNSKIVNITEYLKKSA